MTPKSKQAGKTEDKVSFLDRLTLWKRHVWRSLGQPVQEILAEKEVQEDIKKVRECF